MTRDTKDAAFVGAIVLAAIVCLVMFGTARDAWIFVLVWASANVMIWFTGVSMPPMVAFCMVLLVFAAVRYAVQ